jgi:DNA-directed RNA polymerase subunit beta'
VPVFKAITLAVESKLPPELRDFRRKYDSKSLDGLLASVATSRPEEFADIQHAIAKIGRNETWRRGDTVRMSDLKPVFDRAPMFGQMDKEIAEARKLHRNDPGGFDQARAEILTRYSTLAEKLTMDSYGSQDNNVVTAVASGSRGKPAQVKAMLSTPGVYTDSKGRLIPVFVRNSYSDGLRPGEFLAGTFGARSSVTDTKRSTARGGELLKLAAAATVNQLITENDCGADTGIAFGMDNPSSLLYRVLSRDTAGFPAGTYVDKKVLSALKTANPKQVMVRSATTCQAGAGLCSKCAGGFTNAGKLFKVGDHAGITAAQSLFEPVVQSALSSKHVAGITGTKKSFAGLDAITQFLQAPDNMEYRAAVADEPGEVDAITEAPQGGNYVTVGNKQYYVKPGYEIMVKTGDKLEAGDQISDGIVDARDIIRTQGLGAARKHYSLQLAKILTDSGAKAHPQQTEMLARGALDHINIDDVDGIGGNLPDDVISYTALRRSFSSPDDELETSPDDAVGKYLTRDVAHFTIGTKLSPKMASHLKDNGIDRVSTTGKAPGFTAIMPRLRTASHSQDDWLAVLGTNYLSRNMQDAVTRAADTDVEANTNFIPRLAIGEDFGKNVRTTGKF